MNIKSPIKTKFLPFAAGIVLSVGLTGGLMTSGTAQAEPAISVYGGINSSPHSKVNYNFNQGAGPQSATVGWNGKSFAMPPYYGVRATWWLESKPEIGLAIDFTHAKVYADPLPAGLSVLEFTDGINFLTANVLYRYQTESRFTPYGGVGLGITVPSVEVANATNTSKTKNFQFGGFSAQAMIGVDAKINDNWSVFGELKSSYAMIDADLVAGGSVSTNVISNQIIFGVTFTYY